MADHLTAAEHHDAAARHHDQAMKLHRSASRHYQIGKDYAHAAHQALVAHGHGLQALASADAASGRHQPHTGMSQPAKPIPATAASCCAEHHSAAADEHERAADQHTKACDHCNCAETADAAEASSRARGHAERALYHSNEAARLHAVSQSVSPILLPRF